MEPQQQIQKIMILPLLVYIKSLSGLTNKKYT